MSQEERRRERREGDDLEETQEETNLTQFQQECKKDLIEKYGYNEVVSGVTFGAHLHCYRNKGDTTNSKADTDSSHEHGETLVLCVENSKKENLASDLRYLSVASRIANSTRKRFVVAFGEDQEGEEDTKGGEEKKKQVKPKMIELISVT